LNLQTFLETTKELLDIKMFQYLTNTKIEESLQNSISELCNALEKRVLLEITNSDTTAPKEQFEKVEKLTPRDAWSRLYKSINAYPDEIKQKISDTLRYFISLSTTPEDYTLWANIIQPEDNNDQFDYARLDNLIDDLPEESVYKDFPALTGAEARLQAINQPTGGNFGIWVTIGGVLCATTCVVSLSVAALALASLITLTSQAIALACGVSIASGFFAYSLLRVVNTSNPTDDPVAPSLSS
jgi:hypothetical protein